SPSRRVFSALQRSERAPSASRLNASSEALSMHIWKVVFCQRPEVRLTSQRPDLRWNLSSACAVPAARDRERTRNNVVCIYDLRVACFTLLVQDDEHIDELVQRRRPEPAVVA